MKQLILGLAAIVLLGAGPAQANEGVTPVLKMDTTYDFQFFSPEILAATFPGRPAAVWAFAWEGTVKGDINGVIRWWVELPTFTATSFVGRWEIWDCKPIYPAEDCEKPDQLIMAGYDAGGYVSPTDWVGKGVVTYVGANYLEEYGEWFGRRIADGGYVRFASGLPSYGEGWFTIFNTPSNKH